jgi:hypothetical protein
MRIRVLEALREYYLSHLNEALQILRREQAGELADESIGEDRS